MSKRTTANQAPANQAPAAGTTATTSAAPEASGNVTVEGLAAMFSKRPSALAPAAAPTQTPNPDPAAEPLPETEQPEAPAPAEEEQTETETAPAPEGETEPEPEPETPDQTEPTDQTDPTLEAEPELTPEETDLMTDQEFAEYVSQFTENKAQRKMLQRIHRLTKRLKQMEGNGHQEVEPAKAGTPSQAQPDPLRGNPLLAEIDTRLAPIQEALRFADANPDGGDWTDAQGKVHSFTSEQVRAIRHNAEAERTELLAEKASARAGLRQAYDQMQRAADTEFARAYPALQNPESAEAQAFAATAAMFPEIKRAPDWKMWIAFAMEGRKAWEARQKAKPRVGAPMTRPRGSSEPPAVTTRPAAGAPRVNGHQKAVQQSEKAFQESGKLGDLATMFSARKRMRAQPV